MIELESESRFAQRVALWTPEHLTHCVQNARALQRRRRLSDRMRESLARDVPIMLAEVERRQLTISWRAYPTTLEFGARAQLTDDGPAIEQVAPPQTRDVKRAQESDEPPAISSGELLALLERSVAAHVNGHLEP